MKKSKAPILTIAILCVIVAVAYFAMPKFEHRTWHLSFAQQADAPHFVVAHNPDYDISDEKSELFGFSKPIDLTLEAKDGTLLLTDKTSGKTYEGTYAVNPGLFGRFRAFARSYTIEIGNLEGTANFSTNRTLFMSVGEYYLNFEF